jgi:hypothetical protein
MTQRGEKVLILSVAALVVISVALAAAPVIVMGRYHPPAPKIPLPSYPVPNPNPIEEFARLGERLSARAEALRSAAVARPLPATAAGLVDQYAAVRTESVRLLSHEMLRPPLDAGHDSVAGLRAVGDLLTLDARLALRRGKRDAALESGCALLRAAQVMARNSDAASGIVGQQAATRAVPCLLQCLAEGLTDAQLERLRAEADRAWAGRVPWSESLAGEWYSMDRQLAQWAKGDLLDPADGKRRARAPKWLVRWLSGLIVGRARPETSAAMAALVADARRPWWQRTHSFPQPNTSLARMLLKVWTQNAAEASRRDAIRDACLQGLRTATAIERYRRKTGALPGGLGDLVPAYLEQVPADPCDGQALRYTITGGGYRLYSVGPDRRDEGGKVRIVKPSDPGDLVLWPPGGDLDTSSPARSRPEQREAKAR